VPTTFRQRTTSGAKSTLRTITWQNASPLTVSPRKELDFFQQLPYLFRPNRCKQETATDEEER
jgi:hypothetical protein